MADTRQEKRKPGGRYQGMGHEKGGGDQHAHMVADFRGPCLPYQGAFF